MKNNFNMPTNKIAAVALLKELQRQKISLSNKYSRIQKDFYAGVEKKKKIDAHLENLRKSSEDIKISLKHLQVQEAQINSLLPQLYESQSAARNARLKTRKSDREELKNKHSNFIGDMKK